MAINISSPNPIRFSDISNEFGLPPSRNLGAYRIAPVTIGNLTIDALDDGIPTSGTIRFSNFYSKRLNVVVYCSGNRVNARSLYNDNNNNIVFVIAVGPKTRPESSSGTKVWIHTNETIGSNIPASSAPNLRYCSLITGGWDDNTDLRLDIGTSGVVSGSGGNGGNGGGNTVSAQSGSFGTSAIGVNYQPITITNRGTIQGGTGGGGGGGWAWARDKSSSGKTRFAVAGGGGGGGGKGIPDGAGGAGGDVSTFYSDWNTAYSNGGNGTSGSAEPVGGAGGSGGSASNFAACTGGAGGDHQLKGGDGVIISGPTSSDKTTGADPGPSGYGIIITNNGTGVTISGNARIGGDVYDTTIS